MKLGTLFSDGAVLQQGRINPLWGETLPGLLIAEISGDSILLTSSLVKSPVSVRYAWADNPNNILYNQQFPAASFSSENQ